MPARDPRVAGCLPRLKYGKVLRTLIIISAFSFLAACATTTTSSSNQASFSPKTSPAAAKPRVSEQTSISVGSVDASSVAGPVESVSAPALADNSAEAQVLQAPILQAPALQAQDIQAVPVAASAESMLPTAEQVAIIIEESAPPMILIDAAACTRGLRGELATARAGNFLLIDNGLDESALSDETAGEPQAAVATAALSTPAMTAPSAGTDEIIAEPASLSTALNVRLGQTEGLLVAAYQQTGRIYKAGGQTPSSGFDSAGFTRWVYSQRGVNLPREAKKQALAGRPVAREELRPGDILVYKNPGGKGDAEYHVGIYTGQGNFIHAASKAGVVTETAAFGPQYAPYFVGGRRYYDDPKAAPLSDNQKMAAASSAVKLALSELGPNDKPDRSVLKPKPKAKAKSKKKN